MPEKASGYEPVDILPGNNSIFRAASRTIYHDERFWPILKIGSLAKAVVESEYYVNQVFTMLLKSIGSKYSNDSSNYGNSAFLEY